MQRDALGILTWQSFCLIISQLKAIYIIVIIKVYKGGKVHIKNPTDKIIVPVVMPWLKLND